MRVVCADLGSEWYGCTEAEMIGPEKTVLDCAAVLAANAI
jgi:hypothetical protein